MKVTDSDVIKSGEKELIDTITGDLDWGVIEQKFQEKHKLSLRDDVDYKQGDIVIHNEQVAYKIDFDVRVTLSVVFNRNGEYLTLSTSHDSDEQSDQIVNEDQVDPLLASDTAIGDPSEIETDSISSPLPDESASDSNDSVDQMASEIADMMSDINKD